MNLETQKNEGLFELLPVGVTAGKKATQVIGKRILVGSSQACDITLNHPTVAAIHSVLEIINGEITVYDMSSGLGTFINGKESVSEKLNLGDTLKIGLLEFELRKYKKEEVLPPTLDMLSVLPPVLNGPVETPRSLPKKPESKKSSEKKKLPTKVKSKSINEEFVPRVDYPLAKDPKADFSEYIFEDVETLYPIFDYSVSTTAVEIIILYRDAIYSVDYIPTVDGMYRLTGANPGKKDIEYPYLGKDEKIPFIEIRGSEIFVTGIPGFEPMCLSDVKKDITSTTSINLNRDDIIRFGKGDLQVFVRGTEAPPSVDHAPIMRRDQEFKKYLLLMFALVLMFIGVTAFVEVDKEIEKEKAPERIATILYKKKLVISKKKAIDKTRKKPKQIMQKSPSQKRALKKKAPTKVTTKKKAKPRKKVGKKTARKIGKVRKVTPTKGKRNNLKTKTVRPVAKKAGGKPSKSRSKAKSRVKNSKARGAVDTYKSFEFKSTLSSLMAKGGSTKSVQNVSSTSYKTGESGVVTAGESATLKKANVAKRVGSLVGAASGTLDSTKGVQGVVGEKSIYTAGVPFKTVILGGMDPDVIRRILQDHVPQFRYCYQKILDKSSAAFHGVVRLDFLIGASGHVTKAGVQSASKAMPRTVKSCVVNVLRGIKFPKPLGGTVVEVNQPFNFYPNK